MKDKRLEIETEGNIKKKTEIDNHGEENYANLLNKSFPDEVDLGR